MSLLGWFRGSRGLSIEEDQKVAALCEKAERLMAEGKKQFTESDPGPAARTFTEVLMCLVEVNTMLSGRKGLSTATSGGVERFRDGVVELFTEYYDKGSEACSRGDYVKAACYLGPAVALECRTYFASFKLARIFRVRKEYHKSRKILQDIVEMDPENAEAFRELGSTCVAEAKPRKAIEFLERAAQLDPKNGEAHFLLATCYAEVRDLAQARRHAKSARSLGVSPAMAPLLAKLSNDIGA